jgi:hypothetical protein
MYCLFAMIPVEVLWQEEDPASFLEVSGHRV